MEKRKETRPKGIKGFFSDIKNVKRNLKIVKANPYANLKFRYLVQRFLIFLFILLLGYQIIIIFLNYSGGSSMMTMIGRLLLLAILVIIIYKSWGTLAPLKKALQQYEVMDKKSKEEHIPSRKVDVKTEIDDILSKFNGG